MAEFADERLDQRSDLAYRTNGLYRYLLDGHILPALGPIFLVALSSSKVRSWHSGVAKQHPLTAAKAYRLLSSMMRTAVVDRLILSSPCKVDGAGVERAAERPVATVNEIHALEAAMPEPLQLIVPLATWC